MARRSSFSVVGARRAHGGTILAALLLALMMSACAIAPLRIPVGDIVIPAGSSGGDVCYVRVDEGSPAAFRTATYTATATYEASALIGSPEEVKVRVYGRQGAPAGHEGRQSFCTSRGDQDVALSDELVLSPGQPKEVVVGGQHYGGRLASLIRESPYYIGASFESEGLLEHDQRIVLENGVVAVSF